MGFLFSWDMSSNKIILFLISNFGPAIFLLHLVVFWMLLLCPCQSPSHTVWRNATCIWLSFAIFWKYFTLCYPLLFIFFYFSRYRIVIWTSILGIWKFLVETSSKQALLIWLSMLNMEVKEIKIIILKLSRAYIYCNTYWWWWLMTMIDDNVKDDDW